MKLYLVIEKFGESTKIVGDYETVIFGIFSSEEKAHKVKDELNQNFEENFEIMRVEVKELILDHPTDDYDWFMNN